ncbi:MAG: endonuclease V [Candidatus Bipolaricaulia bacterium]
MGRPSVEVPDLCRATWELIRQVPAGQVTTYRAVAQALGDELASRAVGRIVAEADPSSSLPTHRVVHSDGRVGGDGADAASERLQAEGVPVREGRVVGVRDSLFADFATDAPLKRLQALQDELAAHVDRTLSISRIETVAGVDLSYRGNWRGVGAYVRMDAEGERVQATMTIEQTTPFPYIPTYLAFRELPVLLALLDAVRDRSQMADVVLVDGTGLLHHRHVGIASHLGVVMDVPTVGVTKRLLYGTVETDGMAVREVRWVMDSDRPEQRLGAAIKTSARAHPIYVSVGHRVDLDTAVDLVLASSSRKLPEPIRRADALSREAAREPTPASTRQQALDL